MKIFAMDIGGSSIKYALFDENRNKLDSGKIKTPAQLRWMKIVNIQ